MCPRMTALLLVLLCHANALSQPPSPTSEPLVRVVDLDLGESQEVQLCDGNCVTVKLVSLREQRDALRDAVRKAEVQVEISRPRGSGKQGTPEVPAAKTDGQGPAVRLVSANYQLPVTFEGVRIDCPITKGYRSNSNTDPWALEKDARLRLWPANSPLMRPGTFVCPAQQRWFASSTQMANEPVYVDAGERPQNRKIYYHYGLDFGGCEELVEVVAATDGLVVSRGTDKLPGYDDTPVAPRYDVVYLLDNQGWYYRYSHLYSIDPEIRPGVSVRMGQRLGLLGKEGGSGGWSHLHFDIFCRQPSGKWGCQEAYAFVWEAYLRDHQPPVIAVARPHHVAWVGDKMLLDGSKSFCADGQPARYQWTFTDGSTADGVQVERVYDKPGYYSEILKVTDAQGRVDYDFAIVHVHDREHPDRFPPSIHVVYSPTLGLKPGDEVTFKARTFATTDGEERWDFGDGSAPATTKSDGNVRPLAKDGYAVLKHRYETPGHYVVRVERSDRYGHQAVGHVQVRVTTHE